MKDNIKAAVALVICVMLIFLAFYLLVKLAPFSL